MGDQPEGADRFGVAVGGSRWFSGPVMTHLEPVQAFQVRWFCPMPACRGEMRYTGENWPTGNPGYHHQCTVCKFRAAIKEKQFPMIEFRPIPKSAEAPHDPGRTDPTVP